MKRLTEEQLIDMAMGEPHPQEWDQRIADNPEDRERLAVLRAGLQAAREIEPKPPLMSVPPITYERFRRRTLLTRLSWAAAAAMLALSLLGLRVEVNDRGVAVQFSLLGSDSKPSSEERIALLEQRLLEAIELKSALTQSQIDARLNAFYNERDRDLNAFSQALEVKMNDLDLNNARYLSVVNDNVAKLERERELRGKLQ